VRRSARPLLAAALAAGVAGALVAVATAAVAVTSGAPAVARAPAPPAGAALDALAQPPARTSIASQRIYFVMPDRYANGDPSNDRGGRSGGRSTTGFDPTDHGWFHGGDLRGLTGTCDDTRTGLARIRDLGFTALWVTPPVVQNAVQGDSAGYHGYWGLDFTTVDPHLGSEADFAAFVGCAHRLGLKVYLDVVVNHTADVILPTGGSRYLGPEQVPYRDCKGRRFDAARYAGGKTFPCLKASNMPRVPTLSAGERNLKRPAWLNDVTKYHNRGDVDFGSCNETCYEQGDFYGLDDLFTEQPAVVNGLAEMHADWIRKYKVDGFRIDTAKHVDRAFFRVWVPKVLAAARAAGVPDFELFGEAWVPNAIDMSTYVRKRRLPNLLDFPLQDALVSYAAGDSSSRGVAARLYDDDYFRYSAGVAPVPPTFLGNHDTGRTATLIRAKSGARGDDWLRRVLLGHDLLYLLRGAPVVYYGDEVGMAGSGGDKAARQDMFPTQVAHWRTEERVGSGPIGTGSSFDVVGHPVGERLRELGRLRQAHPALSTGATVVRRAEGSLLAVSRVDSSARREYLALFNSAATAQRITVRTATPAAAWTAVLGGTTGVTSGGDGSVTVVVQRLSSLLLRAEADLPAGRPARPTVTAAVDNLSELFAVRAAVGGTAPVSVGFAVKRAKGGWRRVAADDSPPYRAFLDPAAYKRGERVHVVAVARALDGSTAVSRVVAVTPRRK
jgi:glycosidase